MNIDLHEFNTYDFETSTFHRRLVGWPVCPKELIDMLHDD